MRMRDAWEGLVAIGLGLLVIAVLGPDAAALPALHLAAVAPALTRIDLAEHRLPNRMVVPAIGTGLVAAGVRAASGADVLVPLGAGLGFAAFLFLLGLAGGIGMGDVKLAAAIGLASPTLGIAVAAPFLAFLVGGAASTVVLVRRGRGARVPFGPALLAGYAGAITVAAALG